MSTLTEAQIVWANQLFTNIRRELGKVLMGQEELAEGLLIALASGQHLLLEGVPGLAKTLAIKALARTLGLEFKRLQFTPDLLPSDLIGTQIFHPGRGDFSVKKGPIFAQLILADEVNRAPAKVQSALLEAMEERQVTLGDETFALPQPFLVLATQNPMEQEGTYPLPEAQLDRFMLKVKVDYPDRATELQILGAKRGTVGLEAVQTVASAQDILKLAQLIHDVYIDPAVEEFIVDLIRTTRQPGAAWAPLVRWGASPRASIFLSLAARARALVKGRGFVLPEDVEALALPVLRHRLLLSYEAAAEDRSADDIIAGLLAEAERP